MPAPVYVISRVADPIFAVVVGLGAAATRISREEKDKGRTTSESIQVGLRYVALLDCCGGRESCSDIPQTPGPRQQADRVVITVGPDRHAYGHAVF